MGQLNRNVTLKDLSINSEVSVKSKDSCLCSTPFLLCVLDDFYRLKLSMVGVVAEPMETVPDQHICYVVVNRDSGPSAAFNILIWRLI